MTPRLGSWCDRAACKGMTHIFYSDYSERVSTRIRRERRAKMICSICPVIMECREYARANCEYGVWGGETEDDRYEKGFAIPVGTRSDVARRVKSQKERKLNDSHAIKT